MVFFSAQINFSQSFLSIINQVNQSGIMDLDKNKFDLYSICLVTLTKSMFKQTSHANKRYH